MPLYAGLAETSRSTPNLSMERNNATIQQSTTSPVGALFGPTIQHQAHSEASLWGIEEEPSPEEMLTRSDTIHSAQERIYWERELDVKMVFNFLKNRFSSSPPTTSPLTSTHIAQLNTTTAQRAALIRQQHPLARTNTDPTQNSTARRPRPHHLHNHSQVQANFLRSKVLSGRTRSSSCASQSTKKSRKTGSSRNFWDIGGTSVNSAGAGGGAGFGVWGEVAF